MMNNPLKLVKVNSDQYYWYTEQETDDGGWLLFNGDELINHTEDMYESQGYYDWALWGGVQSMPDGTKVEVPGLLEYPNTFDDAEYQQLVARFDKGLK
jgi:hypothetical protein